MSTTLIIPPPNAVKLRNLIRDGIKQSPHRPQWIKAFRNARNEEATVRISPKSDIPQIDLGRAWSAYLSIDDAAPILCERLEREITQRVNSGKLSDPRQPQVCGPRFLTGLSPAAFELVRDIVNWNSDYNELLVGLRIIVSHSESLQTSLANDIDRILETALLQFYESVIPLANSDDTASASAS